MMHDDGRTSARYQRLKDKADRLCLEMTVADDGVFCVTHRDHEDALTHAENFKTLDEVAAFLTGFERGHNPQPKLKRYSNDQV